MSNIISKKLRGTWELSNLIGAPVSIKSARLGYDGLSSEDLMSEHKIESIKYRVSEEGKIYPIFKLDNINSMYFTADNLIIEGINLDV